ncbi:hypothetical protein ACHAWF_001209 [Thalassiosira exigua]
MAVMPPPSRPHQERSGSAVAWVRSPATLLSAMMLIGFAYCIAATATSDEQHESSSFVRNRIDGIVSLLWDRPSLMLNMVLRVVLATAISVNLDAFLKLVVTPALAATIVGAVATPLTFFVGQTLQPIIFSVCFVGFDDKFVLATLEVTGIKDRLAAEHAKDGEWREMGYFEKFITRYLIKVMAGWTVGIAGIATIVPVVGPILTALLSGWAVAWDVVYVPLSGMGRRGFLRQAKTVFGNFWGYHWFGFWAVLLEEVPLLGPLCHVYNVYNAAFFLERMYLGDGGGTKVGGGGDEL